MSASKDKISKLLECSICFDRLNDPKVLQCTHSYCKCCLDGILQFRDDGSAFIECPLHCSGYTEVGINETTNELKAPLQFKDLLDMLSEEDAECLISHVRKTCMCGGSAECYTSVLYFCPNCNIMLCSICQPNHNHCHHDNSAIEYIPIKYDRKNDIIPWCTKHAAFANFVCQEEFICIYCKEREPGKGHSQKIETVHAEIKTWVNNEIAGSGMCFKDVFQNAILATKTEIATIRNSLTTSLTNRKIKCLSEYLGQLNEDGERLIKEFDFITSNHVKERLSATPTGYVYVNPPFQSIHNKKNIYENVRLLKTGEMTLPALKVNLTEYNYGNIGPLGNIIGETKQEGYLLHIQSEQVTSCSSNVIPEEEIGDTTTSLVKKLEVLLKHALRITPGNSQASCNGDAAQMKEVDKESDDDSSEADSEELVQAFTLIAKVGFFGIRQLCTRKKEEVLIKMLKKKKKIIDIKDKHRVTILHIAAEYGYIHLMRFILNNGYINVDVTDNRKQTPLYYATTYNQPKAAELLIEYNCTL